MFVKLYSCIFSRGLLRIAHVHIKETEYSFCKILLKPYSIKSTTYLHEKVIVHKKNQLNDELSSDNVKPKVDIVISKLNFKCDEDALPFYNLPFQTLLHIYKTTKNDTDHGHCINRLYYLAERLKCPPAYLSKLVASRTFIYSLSFEWLEKSLNTLLENGVPEDRILRDLWVLKYHYKTIEERLHRVKSMGVDKLYPWMVRCSEEILKRSINLSQETKTILGDIKSTKNYLANRLNTTPEAVEEMYYTIPALKRTRAAKIKNFLDFLIEEGFEVQEIARKPRVISASQNTVRLRLEKLRKLGLKEINLNVLCRSRKDFQKYCESIESVSDIKDS